VADKRVPSDADFDAWIEAKPPKELDRQQVIAYLKAKNRVRWWRMQSDFRWAQRMLRKLGRDPEEARWLL
jgi:hypothetical protein